MAEFMARGWMTLNGVWFYIIADTLEEAIQKAKAGEFEQTDESGASMDDWDIDVSSIEENA